LGLKDLPDVQEPMVETACQGRSDRRGLRVRSGNRGYQAVPDAPDPRVRPGDLDLAVNRASLVGTASLVTPGSRVRRVHAVDVGSLHHR
jgi:hypothetical protein